MNIEDTPVAPTLDPTFLAEVNAFIANTNARNSWIYSPHIQVYLRKSMRVIFGTPFNTLEIANVGTQPQRCGFYSAFLEFATQCATNTNRVLFIEHVQPGQEGIYLRRGFIHNTEQSFDLEHKFVNFYKFVCDAEKAKFEEVGFIPPIKFPVQSIPDNLEAPNEEAKADQSRA
jgi:hypothetical protein